MQISIFTAFLVARIKAEGLLAALGGRVFPDAAPEGTPNPCLVYQLIDGSTEDQLDAGEGVEGTAVYQLRIYCGTRSQANELRDALRKPLQNSLPAVLSGWRLTGSSFGELADTYDPETRDFGALAVVALHGQKA